MLYNQYRRIFNEAVIFYNNQKYISILVECTVREVSYENLTVLLDMINYNDHNLMICGDLNICKQAGYTKLSYFFVKVGQ